jgi:hypothetical protein
MKKTINIQKLKVSYILGNYQTLPNYPSSEDVLYEMVKDFCSKPTLEFKFTGASLKTKYQLSDIKLLSILNELSDHGFIQLVENKPSHTTYKLIKNPYET